MRTSLALALTTLLAGSAPAQVLYQTAFDDAAGWTIAGNNGPGCQWAADATPSVLPGGAFLSAPSSLNANNGTCDGAYNLTTAISPPIDLSGSAHPLLRFWCNNGFEPFLESCGYEWRGFSVGNGGQVDNLLDLCMSAVPDCTPPSQGWHEHVFALDPAWGSVQLRFLIQNPLIPFNGVAGWFVDDLVIEEGCPAPPPANYCTAVANSTGQRARMGWQNTTSVANNDFRLLAEKCPPDKPGLFFYGRTPAELTVGDGHLCVTGATYRLPVVSTGPAGTPSWTVNFTSPPSTAGQIHPGDTWYFSFWFRDPPGGPAGFNFSDGLQVTFCP